MQKFTAIGHVGKDPEITELRDGIVKWRTHPYVDNLSKEFKEMIEEKELDHFADVGKMVQTEAE